MADGPPRVALITDVRGSVRLAVDVSTGAVLQHIAYSPFGRELVREGDAPWLQPLGYAGGLTDEATGLVRFGARDYDAYSGRWTALDPIGFAAGDTNLYGYVLQDPVNRVDPLGLADLLWSDGYTPPSAEPGYWDELWDGLGDLLPDSFGVQFEVSAIFNGFGGGGGVWGINVQYFCDERGLQVYEYHTPNDGGALAIPYSFGGSAQGNVAWGEGAWDGEFEGVSESKGSFTEGAFWSPGDGGWVGVSAGGGVDAVKTPWSVTYADSYYRLIWD